jgi:hypothetical protein
MVSDNEVYSAREIALATGVSELQARGHRRAGGDRRSYVRHADAVRIGRHLAKIGRAPFTPHCRSRRQPPDPGATPVWSGTAHAGIVVAAIVIARRISRRARGAEG